MTSDEMERAIEFLLKNQANFDARLEKTEQQIAQTNQQIEIFTETQSEFIRAVSLYMEAQDVKNESMRQTMRDLALSQQQTQQEISDLALAQQQTQRDISDLTKVVNNLVNFSSGNGNPSQE
jgi:prefoldin subunit 5